MDYSRRETVALGGGVAAGLLVGGMLGAGTRRRDGDGGDHGGERPRRRIVGTRDEETVEAACDAVDGEESVVDLGDRRTLVVGPLDEAALSELAADHEIDYVEPDLPVRAADAAAEATTRPSTRPWGIDRIDAPRAHEAGYRGAGARVAIVDSGVNAHSDVAANVADGAAFVECREGCSTVWADEVGHGTACAGVVGATGDGDAITGVAPAAALHPVKVLGADNTGRVSLVVAGLRWAVSRGCDVVNLSLSGPTSRAYDDAVRFAANRGTVVVASAGNVGPCENCINPLAIHPEVLAVTATNREDALAAFSATGPEAELTGPGVAVPTTGLEGYVSVSGTSFSAPHVAGAAALCRAAGRSAATTRELLAGTATPLDLEATAQGNGLVDAGSSVLPGVRTGEPAVDGREVTFRGALTRLEGGTADVWFGFRWRARRRWRETPIRSRRVPGEFSTTVRLRRGLTYHVRAHARLPGGSTVVGERVRFRVPTRR